MNTQVKGAFKETFKYGGEDSGIVESTGKSEKTYEIQFNMPIENRDNLNRFAGSLYSLMGERVDGSKFVVFGQFEAEDLEVDNRIQNRMTLKTNTTSARLFEVNSLNVENIEYIIEDVITPTPTPIPSIPTGFNILANGEDQIDVSWTAQSNTDTFSIEWGIDGFTFPFNAVVAGSETTYSITGLDASTLYYVRMKAVNESGESGYTSISSATTDGQVLEPETIAWSNATGITDTAELERVDTLIKTLKADGNWSLLDYLLFMDQGFTGLIDIKGLVPADVFGGVTDEGDVMKGNKIDGYIYTNIDLESANNYSQNNAFMSGYLKNVGNFSGGIVPFGHNLIGADGVYYFRGNTVQILSNHNQNSSVSSSIDSAIWDDDIVVTMSRDNASSFNMLVDGVNYKSYVQSSLGLTSKEPAIFGASTGSKSATLFSDASIGFLAAGASIGFDHAAFNTAIRTYLGI
jgi:hypothetical protein